MTLLLRRLCAILVMLLTLTPVLAGAAGRQRPGPWPGSPCGAIGAWNSGYARNPTLAKTPGLADMMLGMVPFIRRSRGFGSPASHRRGCTDGERV